jgi:hypothetical protein
VTPHVLDQQADRQLRAYPRTTDPGWNHILDEIEHPEFIAACRTATVTTATGTEAER